MLEKIMILTYISIMTLGSIVIAYHSPIDCDNACMEEYLAE